MASIRPQVALKPPQFGKNLSPALQKFMNKQNEDLENKVSQDSPAGEVKKPPGVARKGYGTLAQNEENNSTTFSVNKPVAIKPPVGAVKPSEVRRSSQSHVPKVFQQDSGDPSENSNRRGSQVNVPKVFQQDSGDSSESNNRRGSQVNVPKVFQQDSGDSSESNNRRVSLPKVFQQNLAAEILKQNYQSNTTEDKKPKPLVKPSFAHPRPVIGSKPPVSNSETSSNESSTGPSITKKPSDIKSEDKIEMGLRESSKVKLPGLEQIPLKSSNLSASANCPPPASDGKVTDFRAMLKSTTSHTGNQFAGKGKASTVIPGVAASNKPETDSTEKTHVPVSNGSISIHELKRQNFSSTTTGDRSSSMQYKKVRLEASFHLAPPKPELPGNVDLSVIRQQYLKTLQSFKNSADPELEAAAEAEGDGVIYDDGVSMRSGPKHQSERVSMIPDMTAEEEEEGPMYNDGCTPKSLFQHQRPEAEDFYVDAETERKVVDEVVEDEDFELLYEDEETFAVSPEKLEEEKKKRQKEEAEAKKREEKEKREKEKEEEKKRKKEEKERVKKEKEEMQLRKKFNLTGEEVSVGEGIIKQDVKGGVLGGLSLKKGQTVTIIRLENNPPNKWLIRTETNIGYIDMGIIEIDTAKIRPVMANMNKGALAQKDDNDDQAFYCDVGQDGDPCVQQDDGEIYEEL